MSANRRECLLGIDIGTSTVKALVVDAQKAAPLGGAAREYPIHHPHAGWAEQDPSDWWHATVGTVRDAIQAANVTPESVRSIGLSGQMHGTVCVDRAGKPLRPAIIWADARSDAQRQAVLDRADPAELLEHAPGAPATGFMAMSLMWLAEHERRTLAATHAVLLPKDYVRLRLTGEMATEVSDAASTWLLDVRRGDWSDALVRLCGLDRRYLPRVLQSMQVAGRLTDAAASELGLPAGIVVGAGCADQAAQALGHGVHKPGTALVTIGTGGQTLSPLAAPGRGSMHGSYVFNHCVPNRWYAAASILAAGLSLRWLRDLCGLRNRKDAYTQLSDLASRVPPGADGLVFLPYLAGERAPHMDPRASGVFVGLRLDHGVGHLARAVMEGVTFALADCLDLIALPSSAGVLATGGGASSPAWRQVQADVYNRTLLLSRGSDHACVGAALVAGVAAGLYRSCDEACALLPKPAGTVTPDPASVALYARRRELFQRLYTRLKDDMHTLRS